MSCRSIPPADCITLCLRALVGIGEIGRVQVDPLGVFVAQEVVGVEVLLPAHVVETVVRVVGLAGSAERY